MFARNVSMNLKPNTLPEFTRTFEKDVVPVLRQQKGFKDEITFSTPGSTDVIAISLWDSKESADAYNSNIYPQVLKTLDRVIDGTPKVRTSDVVYSTFHKISTAVAA
jgi:heme-degrading monooxygenase HmoA